MPAIAAFQAVGRGFESRLPLQSNQQLTAIARCAVHLLWRTCGVFLLAVGSVCLLAGSPGARRSGTGGWVRLDLVGSEGDARGQDRSSSPVRHFVVPMGSRNNGG